jgi:hypothetical protein
VKQLLTAETAEKKSLRILGVLCVLCGKTPHFFTRSGARSQFIPYCGRLVVYIFVPFVIDNLQTLSE